MYSEQMSQGLSVADVVNTQNINNTNLNSIGIDMSKFHRALFVIQCGSLGAAGTVDGRLQSCFEANFAANVNNIANSNLTQINVSTTPGNNAVATIEVRADQIAATDRYVRCQLTGGGNSVVVGIIGLAGEAIHKPGSANNLNNTYLSQQVVVTP
jgi:hypothetical protein